MHTITFSTIAAAVLAVSALAPQIASAANLQPGQGWDTFNARDGETVSSETYLGTALGTIPGQGYDTFHARDGAPIEGGYQSTSMGATPGQGFDTFHVKDGEGI